MLLRNQYVTVSGGAGEDITWTVEQVLNSKTVAEFTALYLDDMGTYSYITDKEQRERTLKLVWDAAISQVIAEDAAPVQVEPNLISNIVSPDAIKHIEDEIAKLQDEVSKTAKPNTAEGEE